MNNHIAKPFDVAHLISTVNEHIAKREHSEAKYISLFPDNFRALPLDIVIHIHQVADALRVVGDICKTPPA